MPMVPRGDYFEPPGAPWHRGAKETIVKSALKVHNLFCFLTSNQTFEKYVFEIAGKTPMGPHGGDSQNPHGAPWHRGIKESIVEAR